MASVPKCPDCKRAFRSPKGCMFTHAVLDDGQKMERERVEFVVDGRCPDCYAPAGKFHHPGCDQEKCPKCGLQILACLGGEFGHTVTGWQHTTKPRRRRMTVAFAVSDKIKKAHVIILSGHTHLKSRRRDFILKATATSLNEIFQGWRAAGIDLILEEKTFPEMADMRNAVGS